jgi:galactokinase
LRRSKACDDPAIEYPRDEDQGPLTANSTLNAGDASALADALSRLDARAASDPVLIRVVHAPGRVNLIGEHTDYNEGYVLPMAIDRGITIAFVPTDDRRLTITLAESGETESIDLDAIGPRTGSWIDYVAGTAWSMTVDGLAVDGFRGLLVSDLPIGAGLSSSAALELASAFALSHGEEAGIDRLRLAGICQRGENDYVGVASGLMDQFASAFGQVGAALLLDCRSLGHQIVPLDLSDVALIVSDSGSRRRLERSAYNERRAQCDAAVAAIAGRQPGVRSLRDVTPAMLDAVSGDVPPLLARRARHVVEENERVLAAVEALNSGDFERFGRLLSESHASLRDLYEVSSPELEALVEVADGVPGVLGSRLTGAGFGGCTITLVRRESVATFSRAIQEAYSTRTGLTPNTFEVQPAAGAGILRG